MQRAQKVSQTPAQWPSLTLKGEQTSSSVWQLRGAPLQVTCMIWPRIYTRVGLPSGALWFLTASNRADLLLLDLVIKFRRFPQT